jgi:hypothetical protein
MARLANSDNNSQLFDRNVLRLTLVKLGVSLALQHVTQGEEEVSDARPDSRGFTLGSVPERRAFFNSPAGARDSG